ncbi:hypothetical protein [Clostridium sp.]|uniref:ABC transporter permease n=1 Tax=Clostridium sp. TaxID=1506 RepID=UPI003217343D
MKKVFHHIVISCILIFLLLPIISIIIWAFFSAWKSTYIWPSNFNLSGFQYFFNSKDWYIGLKSVVFSMEVGFVSLILSIMLSRFFITSEIKHKVILESVFYLPMLLPVISICLGSHKLFLRYFSSCGVAIMILHIYFSLPYAFKMVYSYYTVWGIEDEIIARGLGASPWQGFLHINIPIYFQGYISSFFMAFIVSYSQYFINFFIGNSNHINFSMIMTPYITNSNRNIAAVYTLMYLFYSVIVMQISSLIMKRFKVKNMDM